MSTVKVKATRLGWDGLQRRRPDDVFDWPEGRKVPAWLELVNPVASPELAKGAEKERQRAEHAKLLREGFGGNTSTAAQEVLKAADPTASAKK